MTGTEAFVELAKVLGSVVIALGSAGGLALAALKRWPPRSASLASEVADLKHDMRLLSDYVHDLREEIARNGGTPPDWPEGLRL